MTLNRNYHIWRFILSFFLLTIGLSKIVPILPMMEMPQAAMDFLNALVATGYLFYFIALVEIVTGLMLLSQHTTPLALVLLAPITVNVILFHIFLAPLTILPAIFLLSVHLYLTSKNLPLYHSIYSGVFHANADVTITEKSIDGIVSYNERVRV